MKFQAYLFNAWKQNKHRLLESILIILTVALGVGVLIVVQTYTINVKRFSDEIFEKDSLEICDSSFIKYEDFIYEQTFYPLLDWADLPDESFTLTINDYLNLKEILTGKALLYACQWREHFANWDGHYYNYCGTMPDFFASVNLETTEGRLFDDMDVGDKKKVAVLGSEIAQELFPDESPIGDKLMFHGHALEVIGVLGNFSDKVFSEKMPYIAKEINRYVFVPRSIASYELVNASAKEVASLDRLEVEPLGGSKQIDYLIEKIDDYFLREHKTKSKILKPDFDQEYLSTAWQTSLALSIFACWTLLIAAINIMNLMTSRVLKRGKSIGLSVALGAEKRTIFKQFIFEALFLGGLGGSLGIALALVTTNILNKNLGYVDFAFEVQALVIGVITPLLLIIIFGIYPASLSLGVKPADSLE